MRKWLFSTLSILLLAQSLLAGTAAAVTSTTPTTPSSNNSGQGLEISPPVIELQADPGKTVTTSIRIRNVASSELIAKGKADDFGAGNTEDGQPKLLLDEVAATRYSLKYWVNGVPDLRLAPGELKTTTVTFNVPKNAEPGGHFGVIRFTAVPPGLDTTGVALSASIGTLVLLRVSGDIKDSAALASFKAGSFSGPNSNQNQLRPFTSTSFFETGPIGFEVRAKNDGSVHEKVTGEINITDSFGGKTASLEVNPKGGNILPDSIRKFQQTLDKKQLFGYYTAKLNLSYLGGAKKLTGQTSFWVIPWKLLLLVILGLIVIGFLLTKGLSSYKARIIAQARRR